MQDLGRVLWSQDHALIPSIITPSTPMAESVMFS